MFSGNEFKAEKNAIAVSMQVCKAYSEKGDYYNIILYDKAEKKRRCGIKQQIIILSKEEIFSLSKKIQEITKPD